MLLRQHRLKPWGSGILDPLGKTKDKVTVQVTHVRVSRDATGATFLQPASLPVLQQKRRLCSLGQDVFNIFQAPTP